ncbi:MAG TPA: hypothetical protein VFY43_01215, partial [Candidatus Limnocylindria bacterium]|nr:hypothetical protein [Candidatus Limnocylindria bacterium]
RRGAVRPVSSFQYSTAPYRIAALRGQAAEALPGVEIIEREMLPKTNADERILVRARLAEIRDAFGQYEAAVHDIEDVLAIESRVSTDSYGGPALPFLTRVACRAGRVDLAERILAEARAPNPLAIHAQAAARALVAEHRGRLEEAVEGHRDAAERWAAFTRPVEEAHAHLGHARCLIALGREAAAAAPLDAARAICERMGAAPMLAEISALPDRRTATRWSS